MKKKERPECADAHPVGVAPECPSCVAVGVHDGSVGENQYRRTVKGKQMTQRKIAFVSDFDGTISDDDFFAYTAKAYFDERALAPWRAFLAGQKTHFDALKEMFSQIHVPVDELRMLIDTIRIDPDLEAVWQICKEKEISLYVCSAANDYYIRHLIGTLMKKFNVTLISNKGE